jgi:hypothetical protein
MIVVQSTVIDGNDVGFEKARRQSGSSEGKPHRLVESDLAVVPMQTDKPTLNRVRLGPEFLVSYGPIIARASARVCIYSFFIFFSLLQQRRAFH